MLLEYHITFVLRYLVVIIKWEIEAKDSVFVLALHNTNTRVFRELTNVYIQHSGGSRISQSGHQLQRGSPTFCLPKFIENSMKKKEIGRGCPKFYYVDPPLTSLTVGHFGIILTFSSEITKNTIVYSHRSPFLPVLSRG